MSKFLKGDTFHGHGMMNLAVLWIKILVDCRSTILNCTVGQNPRKFTLAYNIYNMNTDCTIRVYITG